MQRALISLLTDWEAWATEADKSNDGWQSDYPHWAELMNAATKAMEQPDTNVAAIEKCWLLSEEDEWLADHVRENPSQYVKLLTTLARSKYPSVRWQVYASLEEAGCVGIDILEVGSTDPDAYARRRAIFALAKVQPDIAFRKLNELGEDPDPTNRAVLSKLKEDLSKIAMLSN